ncbi:MAG TPA: patatin-like phospholipase family protein [Gemmatimonadaceae bacterium]|jgi:predicted acylesterase/phospholipase RssA|nr:patatin-like phospholipase family protein [Gemmatimonadaceae bacterium]
MRRPTGVCLVASAVLASIAPMHAVAQTARPDSMPVPPGCPAGGRTALVLGGGGARSLSEIGVIMTLDSAGIRPDVVIGSSMGAVVGALYASGYSGRQLDSIVHTLPLQSLFRSTPPDIPQVLGTLHPLLVVESGSRGLSLQSLATRENVINALMDALMLRGNLIARGNFSALRIPFRAVATDLRDRSPVILDHGDLAQAVRASYSLPIVFKPVRMQNHVLVDGGVSANVPIQVARSEGATRLIVADLTRSDASINPDSPLDVSGRLIDFLFEQRGDTVWPGDIHIRSPVADIGSLSFNDHDIDAIIAVGQHAATRALRMADCLPVPNGPENPGTVPARVTSITVQNAGHREARILRDYLNVTLDQPVDVPSLQQALRRLSVGGRYQAVWLEPRGTDDTVAFDATIDRSPRGRAGLGLAYDDDVGGRVWLGGSWRPFSDRDLTADALVAAGALRTSAVIGFTGYDRVRWRLLQPFFLIGVTQEQIRQFDDRQRVTGELTTREVWSSFGVERELPAGWTAELGAEARAWEPPDAPDLAAVGGVARLRNRSPSGDTRVQFEGAWTTRYDRQSIDLAYPMDLGRLSLTPRLRYAVGEHLPLELTYPLGGMNGFPGLRIDNDRGDREAMAELDAARRIFGPVAIRVEVATGQTSTGGLAFPTGAWLVGVRGGLGADTPVGPVRLEYGATDRGQRALFVRIGYWF